MFSQMRPKIAASVQNRCTKDYRRDFRAKGGIRVFVFQTTRLQNSRVWILPGWFCNLAFGELQIESRQMTTRQVICQVCG